MPLTLIPPPAILLSHAIAQGGGAGGAIGWSLVLIALVVVAFFAVARLRHWMQSDDDADAAPRIGFTLSDLRQLRREGKMTEEEFERAREKMMAGAKAMTSKLPDPLTGSRRARQQQQGGEAGDASDGAADDDGDPDQDAAAGDRGSH